MFLRVFVSAALLGILSSSALGRRGSRRLLSDIRNVNSADDIFASLDVDGDGMLTLQKLGANATTNGTLGALSEENAARVLELLDSDGDGSITRAEFVDRLEDALETEGGLGNLLAGCSWGDDACYDDQFKTQTGAYDQY
jgi:hypothetical protein